MPKEISCGARAIVTIELSGLGSWGGDCDMKQVYKQGAEAAVGRIHNTLGQGTKILAVKITAVIAEERDA